MLTKTQKELLTRLDLKYPAIALKTRFEIPPVSPHLYRRKACFLSVYQACPNQW